MNLFNFLPLAAILDGKFIVMHAGISPEFHFVSDINKIKRDIEPPLSGALCDLLWSDPIDNNHGNIS